MPDPFDSFAHNLSSDFRKQDIFARMLAGMDAPRTGVPEDLSRKTREKYIAQRSARGLLDLVFGSADLLNMGVNAAIRDVGYFTSLYDPNTAFQFPSASQSAANLAAEVTGADIVPREAVPITTQRAGDFAQLTLGMAPISPSAAIKGAALAMVAAPMVKIAKRKAVARHGEVADPQHSGSSTGPREVPVPGRPTETLPPESIPIAAGPTDGGKIPRNPRTDAVENGPETIATPRDNAAPQAVPDRDSIAADMALPEAMRHADVAANADRAQAGTLPVITAPSEKWKRLTAMPAEPKPGTAAYSPYSELDGLFRDDPLPPVPQIPIPRYVPPRGVPQRVLDLTADTRVRDGMIEAAERGFSMGVADWYKTQQLKWAFIDEFGKREGSERFDYFMDLVGATSPVSAPWENIRNASYYYTLNNRRLPDVNPYPYGHRFQNMHRRNVMKVWNGGLDPLVNPKPVSFGANLKGNHASVVIDLHNIRLPVMLYGDPRFLNTYLQVSPGVSRNIRKEFAEGRIKPEDLANPTYWTGIPRKNEHGAMERYYQDIARQMGRSPEDVQSAIWIGGGGLTGQRFEPWKTWMDSYKDRLLLTVREKRMDPRDVLKRMLRAELPLLTLGGVAIAPSLMRREMEERPASR